MQRMHPTWIRPAKDVAELAFLLHQVDCQHANESALADPILFQAD